HRAAALGRYRDERRARFVVAGSDHHRNFWLEDSALFRRDRGNRIAEIFHVIEADWSNHAQNRRHYIGRVQPAAEPGLDHGNIDAFLREIEEHHRDGEFEEGESQPGAIVDGAQALDITEHPRR